MKHVSSIMIHDVSARYYDSSNLIGWINSLVDPLTVSRKAHVQKRALLNKVCQACGVLWYTVVDLDGSYHLLVNDIRRDSSARWFATITGAGTSEMTVSYSRASLQTISRSKKRGVEC